MHDPAFWNGPRIDVSFHHREASALQSTLPICDVEAGDRQFPMEHRPSPNDYPVDPNGAGIAAYGHPVLEIASCLDIELLTEVGAPIADGLRVLGVDAHGAAHGGLFASAELGALDAFAGLNIMNWIVNLGFDPGDAVIAGRRGGNRRYSDAEIQSPVWAMTSDEFHQDRFEDDIIANIGTCDDGKQIHDMAIASADAADFRLGYGDVMGVLLESEAPQHVLIGFECNAFAKDCECNGSLVRGQVRSQLISGNRRIVRGTDSSCAETGMSYHEAGKILRMTRTMFAVVGIAALFATHASATPGGDPLTSVPEIDALSGLAAMGVSGGLALVWERRRRR